MKKNSIHGYSILGIIFIAFTLISFIVPFEKNGIFWMAYVLGVFSIIFQIPVLKNAFSGDKELKSKIYGFPIAKIGVLYLILQMVISIIEMTISTEKLIWIYIVINIIIMVLTIIGCIFTDIMRDEIVKQETNDKINTQNMKEMQMLSQTLADKCKDIETKKILNEVIDKLRYSDPITCEKSIKIETEIIQNMNEIRKEIDAENFETAKTICNELVESLNERNNICKLYK